MKNKKILWITVCAVVLLAAVTATTLAYLTDRNKVVNTFTVGDVQIALDEAEVVDGELTGNRTAQGNNYHLIPGKSFVKDPTMTVLAGSEPAYVRMLLSVNCGAALDDIFAAHELALAEVFVGYHADWVLTSVDRSEDNIVYEFRYAHIVTTGDADEPLPALFTELAVPAEITGDEMRTISDLEITVVGEAIQAETFTDADEAWVAFDGQVNR